MHLIKLFQRIFLFLLRQKKLKLADPYEKTDNFPIEGLIGPDFYWTVMTVKPPKKQTESLVLMPSIFGWILSGSRSMTDINFDKTSTIHNICTGKVTLQKEDEDVRTFWDLETLGIEACFPATDEQWIEQRIDFSLE
ncbi:hypothetical protein AVEN_117383-1 [Araneus ventricosus]|uniref:Uncharacterized protein n=1 Tax=Araneus ventricosus TaxID=182803 RepID=A0A4Y2E403_ARAVE|nr:hypothetical protein AVEN_117383-1 [Araneus ventricosus]